MIDAIEEMCAVATEGMEELEDYQVHDFEEAMEEEVSFRDHEGNTIKGRMMRAILGKPTFFRANGAIYHVDRSEGSERAILVCADVRIVTDTRDGLSHNWGRILEFRDKDKNPQQYHMRMQDLRRDGDEVIDALLSRGLAISPGKKARLKLVEYVQNTAAESETRARTTDKTGWYENRFILPDAVVGDAGSEPVICDASTEALKSFAQQGACAEWKDNVAALCVGNSRLVFSVSTAFAAPILYLVGEESGGFNLVGNSSIGKSTALYAAASPIGNPKAYIQPWRATSNGLEGIAKLHNDALLILDEMGQVQPKEGGEIAYMLSNGAGKLRANIKGEARQKATWRLLFLSSGEVTLADHMSEGGKQVRAGQEIRLADIPADCGIGHGIFECLHGFPNGAALSEAIKERCSRYYGTPFREFIAAIISDVPAVKESVRAIKERFVADHLPEDASGQIHRLAGRFALVAAAGEMASKAGITGWDEGVASEAAAVCFRALVERRGGAGLQEEDVIVGRVLDFIERHGDARFSTLIKKLSGKVEFEDDRPTINRAGFKIVSGEEMDYYLLPAALDEISTGYNKKEVIKILVRRKIILPESDKKTAKSKRVPTLGMMRLYHIPATGLVREE